VQVTPLDSSRSRVYVASVGLWLTLDAGTFDGVEVNSQSGAVRAGFSGATQFMPQVRLRVEQPAKVRRNLSSGNGTEIGARYVRCPPQERNNLGGTHRQALEPGGRLKRKLCRQLNFRVSGARITSL